jgi:hypothetical protein
MSPSGRTRRENTVALPQRPDNPLLREGSTPIFIGLPLLRRKARKSYTRTGLLALIARRGFV